MLHRVLRNEHSAALAYGVAAMVLIHVIGTIGYMIIGHPTATVVDSFYMTFITVATIGYGEVIDLSHHPMGRLFTVLIAVLGIATMSFLFSTLVAVLLDSKLNVGLRRKRMEKQIAKLSGHYIVCGIGRVGSNVTSELLKTKRPVVIIESDREALDRWLEHHPQTPYLHDDATSDDALRAAGLMSAAGVFAVTPEDSQNLMVSLSVKLLNPKARVVARLHDISNAKKAKRAGADEVISPDFTGGMRIASAMVRPHVVNFMEEMLHTDEGLRVEEVTVASHIEATPLIDLVPRSRDYMLMATHEHGKWLFNPADDHLVKAGTTLVLLANPGGRAHLEHLLNNP